MTFTLDEIKKFDHVIIQPHNFPDADAIASAFGLKEIINKVVGITAEIVYFGPPIDKPSLLTLVDTFGIPLKCYSNNEELELDDDTILICVDCHHFGGNVTKVIANNVAYVDHHETNKFEKMKREESEEEGFKYIFEYLDIFAGSCSALVTSIGKQINYEFSPEVASALTVGIMKDTKQLTTNYQPIDHEAIGYLYPYRDNEKVNSVNRVNYTEAETKLVIELFSNMKILGNVAISFLKNCPDNNTVGQLADLLCEVEGVNMSILYANRLDYYRFSVRSFNPAVNPSSLISYITKGIGGGGGKKYEAAGSIDKFQFSQLYNGTPLNEYVEECALEYCNSVYVFESGKDDPISIIGESKFKEYRKKNYNVRYLKLDSIINEGDTLTVRTQEGLVEANYSDVIIFGVQCEVYPISYDLFSKLYKSDISQDEVAICDAHIPQNGIFFKSKGEHKKLGVSEILNLGIAKYSNTNQIVKASKLDVPFMINIKGGTLAAPRGGYLVIRDKDDIYICDTEVFEVTFREHIKQPEIGGLVYV